MNRKIIDIIHELNIHPIAYQKIKSVYVIKTKELDYAIKLNTNNYDIYKYLLSRDYRFYPKNYNQLNDDFDISLYINGLIINNEQKINDYIKLIALLHQKTSYKREINLDEIKDKYESIIKKINKLREYYLSINEKINHELFLSPRSYLLVRNISLIYNVLDSIELLINELYQENKEEKSIRVALLHNNVDLDHLIIGTQNYLISWDKAYFNSPIYEIEDIYRKYYNIIELNDLLSIYENVNELNLFEKKLLIINLALPKELQLTNNTYNDTKIINNEITYLSKVYKLLIKYRNEI